MSYRTRKGSLGVASAPPREQSGRRVSDVGRTYADAEQLLARKQLRQLLDAVLDTLPLEQRTVLVLHELEGFSLAEVASLLEVPPGTVDPRLARARKKFSNSAALLRSRWNKHGTRSDEA